MEKNKFICATIRCKECLEEFFVVGINHLDENYICELCQLKGNEKLGLRIHNK